jgi:hypothetical protein
MQCTISHPMSQRPKRSETAKSWQMGCAKLAVNFGDSNTSLPDLPCASGLSLQGQSSRLLWVCQMVCLLEVRPRICMSPPYFNKNTAHYSFLYQRGYTNLSSLFLYILINMNMNWKFPAKHNSAVFSILAAETLNYYWKTVRGVLY